MTGIYFRIIEVVPAEWISILGQIKIPNGNDVRTLPISPEKESI